MFGVGLTLPKISAVLLNAIGGLLAAYKINDLTPDLVADFNGSLNDGTEFYDAGGTVDTFAELITHSRAGNATMTDGYGPELWTNPAQTLQGPWVSAGSGVYTIDGSQSGTVGVIDDDFVVIGKSYSITYTVSNRSAGGVTGQVGSVSGNTNISDGTYTDIVVATATNKPRVNANSSFIGTVSKISVREIPAIKWAPHNLVTYSEDFSNPAWEKGSCTESSGLLTATGVNAFIRRTISSTQHIQTFEAVVSSGTSAFPYILLLPRSATDVSNQGIAYFNLTTGTVHSTQGTAISADIVALDSGEYKISLTVDTSASTSVQIETRLGFGNTVASQTTIIGNTLNVSKTNLYRSDLGGMVDNPETGDSYVPTTSSAVYLPRRNHHVYNGDAWVNEGVLHESEARTNLLLNNLNLYSARNSVLKGFRVLTASVVPASTQLVASFYLKPKSVSRKEIAVNTDAYTFPAIPTTGLPQGVWTRVETEVVTGTGGVQSFLDLELLTATAPTYTQNSGIAPDGTLTATEITDGTYTYEIWGAQLEEGSTPSSLIPTNSATVTRAAETLTIPAVNMPWPEPKTITGNLYSGADPITITGDHTFTPTIADDSTTKVVRVKWTQTINTGTRTRMRYRNAANSADVQAMTYSNGSGTFEAIIVTSVGLMWRQVETGINVDISDITFEQIDPLSVSIQMQGRMTYADTDEAASSTGATGEAVFCSWKLNNSYWIAQRLDTTNGTGQYNFGQRSVAQDVITSSGSIVSPNVLVPYNIASRHGSTFINGAVDGVALTANTTPVALPDLSATDFNLGYDYMGTISMLRVWADDLADAGIVEATEPSEVPSLQLTFDNSETSFTIQDWEQ